MIQCVVFDFDGTLVLSNAIKREAFFFIATKFEQGVDRMTILLDQDSGDRSSIIQRFAEETGCVCQCDELVAEYSKYVHNGILSCQDREGAIEILSQLRHSSIPAYVNSATPQNNLEASIRERYPAGTFQGVYGGSNSKFRNLKAISAHAAVAPEEIVMVGDGIDDANAAEAFGCAFVGVAGGGLERRVGSSQLSENLTDIAVLLGSAQRGVINHE